MIEWGTRGKASVLVDGQFGSTGKGAIAAWLATRHIGQAIRDVELATCNAGAQAGHTTQYADGRKFVCYHLPTTAVVQGCRAYVNAGSIVDAAQLAQEIKDTGMSPRRIVVDPRAAFIEPEDRDAEHAPEAATTRTASTQKGVGHALSRKIMRTAKLVGDHSDLMPCPVEKLDLNSMLAIEHGIVVEVPQGLDLSINHGLAYPYTTSRDCWVGSGLSDAGIHPSFCGPVAMVVRTFPIRVGRLYNELGEVIGDSGPFYPDSEELDWAKDLPGVEPERTTVTKRVRRIATWSQQQYRHALIMNRPTIVALTFCDYLRSAGEFFDQWCEMESVEIRLGIMPEHIFAFGPNVEDVTDDVDKAEAWYARRK